MEPAEDTRIEFEQKENYIFYKKIAKPLKYVFGSGTREYELARSWLDKLEAVETTTLDEIRIRNLYMSHLVACLNEAQLTGPFTALPKAGQLEAAEFGGQKVQSNPTVFTLQREPAPKYARAPAPPKTCQCGYVCCDVDEFAEQCPQPQNYDTFEGPNDNFCGYVDAEVSRRLMNNIAPQVRATRKHIEAKIEKPGLRASSEPSPRMTAGGACRKETNGDLPNNKRALMFYGNNTNSRSTATNKAPINPEPTDQIELLVQIQSLLRTIASEVCGEAAPGQNSLLEEELAGYKNFLEVELDLSALIKKLEVKRMLRPYLIFHFQSDLVKVLNDEVDPKKERAAKN